MRRADGDRAAALLRALAAYLGAAFAVAMISLPVVVEQAVEKVTFDDRIATLPVEMSLCHQGRSTLSTGVLGDVHWKRTGAFGLGINARVTNPPQAGSTMASYVDPAFIRANVDFLDDPESAVHAYADEFVSRITARVARTVTVVGLVGGLLVLLLVEETSLTGRRLGAGRRRVLGVTVVAVFAAGLSFGGAAYLFQRWPCNGEPAASYAMPGVPQLSFSSPQTLELARQVQTFREKNTERLTQQTEEYERAADRTLTAALASSGDRLRPRAGEVVVLAEADPQGSFVGTAVRTTLVSRLVDHLGADAIVLRTISGDVSSNGTVAEAAFVSREAKVGGDIPVAAVLGDHDSALTERQLRDSGVLVPDLETRDVGGLRVSGANDVERKALFGALVSNDSGLTETQLGRRLRDQLSEDDAGIVLLHQPDAAAGYLGVGMSRVRALQGSVTQPYDDGISDLPAGTVDIGHLHVADGPWVIWNTDGEETTWTVVDQLGTAGGVENKPTFNRFSTPVSLPLKPLSFRIQYVDAASRLQTGYATVQCDLDGVCSVTERVDVGLPLPR